MNLCTACNIFISRSYGNDIFPCNNKSMLISTLLFLGIIICVESHKNLGHINKKWSLSSNGPLQLGQSVLSDKKIIK